MTETFDIRVNGVLFQGCRLATGKVLLHVMDGTNLVSCKLFAYADVVSFKDEDFQVVKLTRKEITLVKLDAVTKLLLRR